MKSIVGHQQSLTPSYSEHTGMAASKVLAQRVETDRMSE